MFTFYPSWWCNLIMHVFNYTQVIEFSVLWACRPLLWIVIGPRIGPRFRNGPLQVDLVISDATHFYKLFTNYLLVWISARPILYMKVVNQNSEWGILRSPLFKHLLFLNCISSQWKCGTTSVSDLPRSLLTSPSPSPPPLSLHVMIVEVDFQ